MRTLLPSTAALAVLVALWTASPLVVAQTSAPSLQVSVVGFRDRTGQAVVALYDRGDAWLNVTRAASVRRVPIRGNAIQVTFDGLVSGHTYAVTAVHDVNGNDRMDMEWFPWPHPAEGAGASRNPRPSMGPPSWDASSFALADSQRIAIELAY